MKEIDENRFQKKTPESIAFQGAKLPETPPPPPIHEPERAERTNGRTDAHHPFPTPESVASYVVRVPTERRKTRHPFDIYEDQLDALCKMQLAEREEAGQKSSKTLGEMAQEALDRYIADKTKKLPSMKLIREE
jgi:hypothetical protein